MTKHITNNRTTQNKHRATKQHIMHIYIYAKHIHKKTNNNINTNATQQFNSQTYNTTQPSVNTKQKQTRTNTKHIQRHNTQNNTIYIYQFLNAQHEYIYVYIEL